MSDYIYISLNGKFGRLVLDDELSIARKNADPERFVGFVSNSVEKAMLEILDENYGWSKESRYTFGEIPSEDAQVRILTPEEVDQVAHDFGLHVPEDWAFYSVVKTLKQLQMDFDSYRETAEEISQCYNDCHSDSWIFEVALREIARSEIGKDGEDSSWRILAQQTLERVWKRRENRANAKG